MTSFFRKLRWLMRRPDKEAELQEELEFHLEEEAGERQAQGLAGEEARRAARRELGNVTLVQEDTRAAWTWTAGEQLVQDVRYGLRTIAANKTFSAMAILSLALGIGANTAIFSFMDSILLRSLPVPDPQSLVMLSWRTPRPEMHGSNRHDESYNDLKGGYVGGIFAYPGIRTVPKERFRLLKRLRISGRRQPHPDIPWPGRAGKIPNTCLATISAGSGFRRRPDD